MRQLPAEMIKSFLRRLERWRRAHGRALWYLPVYLLRLRKEQEFDQVPAGSTDPSDLECREVRLVPVETQEQRQRLLELYWRNPSKMMIAPDSEEKLAEAVASGIDYYLIHDESNQVIGALGHRPADHYLMHWVTDYSVRRTGFGVAAHVAAEDLVRSKGGSEMRCFVFEKNTRMIASCKNTGWEECGRDRQGEQRLIVFSKKV